MALLLGGGNALYKYPMDEILSKAIAFAAEKHESTGQTYDGGPYTNHLKAVAEVAEKFGCTDSNILAAC